MKTYKNTFVLLYHLKQFLLSLSRLVYI